MKVAIVGSREFTDYNSMIKVMDKFLDMGVDTIVSGGARGADTLGETYARDNGLKFICHLPAHKLVPPGRYHPNNFFTRNTLIARDADFIIGFVNDVKSNGTWDTMEKGLRMGKKVYVYWNAFDTFEPFRNQDSPMKPVF